MIRNRDSGPLPASPLNRQRMAAAHAFDTGQRCKLGQKTFVVVDLARVWITLIGQRDIEEHRVRRIKARVDVKYVHHTANQQSRADEQSETQCGLSHDERVMQPVTLTAEGYIESALSQSSCWVRV